MEQDVWRSRTKGNKGRRLQCPKPVETREAKGPGDGNGRGGKNPFQPTGVAAPKKEEKKESSAWRPKFVSSFDEFLFNAEMLRMGMPVDGKVNHEMGLMRM